MAKKLPQPNTSSTADIAFLLLIFFLLTTTMDTDTGITRRLPPPVDEDVEQKVEERNTLVVLVSYDNRIMCEGEEIQLSELKAIAKEFIDNPNNSSRLPKKVPVTIEFLGDVEITKPHVISLQNDRATKYWRYMDVQNELIAAYNELRDELSLREFGKPYDELDEPHQKAVAAYYPQKISEAEPKTY